MAGNFANSKVFFLKDVRPLWLDIFKPGQPQGGGTPKYKVSALIEKDSENLEIAKKAMIEAAQGLWGPNAVNVIKSMAANNKALRNGNDKIDDSGAVRPEYAGKFYISLSNKEKPQVIAQKKHNGKYVTITEDGRAMVDGMDVTGDIGYPITVPYRGCRVNLKCEMVAGKSFKGKDGEIIPNQVFGKIIAVQFVRDDEAFGAGPTSAEGFEDEEVTAGGGDTLDDDIAF